LKALEDGRWKLAPAVLDQADYGADEEEEEADSQTPYFTFPGSINCP
jgi:hypothetical protein